MKYPSLSYKQADVLFLHIKAKINFITQSYPRIRGYYQVRKKIYDWFVRLLNLVDPGSWFSEIKIGIFPQSALSSKENTG